MKSEIMKRSMLLNGRKTAISLENEFYDCLREIADLRRKSITELVEEIDNYRLLGNLSSAVRVFVLDHYKGSGMGRSMCNTTAFNNPRH